MLFKYLNGHVLTKQFRDEMQMTQSPLYHSHALGQAPERVNSSDMVRKRILQNEYEL